VTSLLTSFAPPPTIDELLPDRPLDLDVPSMIQVELNIPNVVFVQENLGWDHVHGRAIPDLTGHFALPVPNASADELHGLVELHGLLG
jgi:hypothetical protein